MPRQATVPPMPPEFPPTPDGYGHKLTPEIVASFIVCSESGYYNEESIIKFIRSYLLTRQQWFFMTGIFSSIEDVLNARFPIQHEEKINEIFADWNKKLGAKMFGF